MRISGLAFFLFVFLMLAQPVMSFDASIQPLEKDANSTSPAEYRVQISNDDFEDRRYSVSLISPKNSWFYLPGSVSVEARSNASFPVTVTPVEDAIRQRYRFDIRIREDNGEEAELSEFFTVDRTHRIEITSLSLVDDEINPGEKVQADIRIRNVDNQPVEDYSVKSTFIDKEKTDSGTKILPGGEREFSFSFEVPESSSPGEKNLDFDVMLGQKVERELSRTFTVNEISDIQKTREEDNRVLVVRKTLKAENRGNAPAQASVEADIPDYLVPITSFSESPDQIEELENSKRYVWTEELQPDEEYSVEYRSDYYIPLGAVMILLMGVAAIKRLGQDIRIDKFAEEEEDGRVKISLNLKNTGEKSFEELEVHEFIPDVAEVDPKFEMNTPKTRETSEGTELVWKIREFEPGDERIIQYKIKPKIQVEEPAELESAVVKDMNGQKLRKSNKVEAEFNTDTS